MEIKSKIHEFDPVIYPRKLYVIDGYDEDLLSEFSHGADNGDLKYPDNCHGVTFPYVRHRESLLLGVLVCFGPDKKNITGMIAHEAVHAANGILNSLGVTYTTEDDETLAYLVGWAADCIAEVINNKNKE